MKTPLYYPTAGKKTKSPKPINKFALDRIIENRYFLVLELGTVHRLTLYHDSFIL
jgi:hypothetical protein